MKILFSLLFGGFLSFSGWSQQEISVNDAVLTALQNNYDVQMADLQQVIGAKNNTWSEAGAYPTVDIIIGQNNSIQDNRNNPFTFTPGVILSQSINPSVNVNYNIFTGFAVRMSKVRLEQLEAQSANNAQAVMETAVQDVLKAYYTAKLHDARTDMLRNVYETSKDRVSYYELKQEYSSGNSLELMQFRNQMLTDSSNLILQKLSYTNSVRNLLLLMNDTVTAAEDVVLVDPFDIGEVLIDADLAMESMLENNRNLKNQYINVELQRTNTELQKSFLYPTLSFQLGANPSWNRFEEIQDNLLSAETQNLVYYGNFSLRYSLFNNWKNKRAVEVSRIQEQIAEISTKSMEVTLTNTLKNLLELYEVRNQLVGISEQNLEYAEKTFELAEDRFERGTINSIDLATIQSNYRNALIQHYENIYNRMDTYLEIYRMTGQLSVEYPTEE
ncbi:MAG: TolC family protein [bacterium]|nr:TolC family protein [bacterium]